jgi:hypothetical protein
MFWATHLLRWAVLGLVLSGMLKSWSGHGLGWTHDGLVIGAPDICFPVHGKEPGTFGIELGLA